MPTQSIRTRGIITIKRVFLDLSRGTAITYPLLSPSLGEIR